MIKMRKILLTAVLLSVSVPAEEILGDLKLVFTVFRHGDRSPIDIYPRDEYQAGVWRMGLGELTYIGKKNAYDLGVYFQQRYKEKLDLDKDFKPNSPEFYIRSTAIHRTKMSAVYFLAGFYGEDFQNVLQKEEEFQEKYNVPFAPEEQDQLLSMTSCPKADKLITEWKDTSTEYKDFIKSNQDLLKLMENTGWSDPNLIDNVIDDIYCETSHNLVQPEWVKPNLQSLLKFWDESKKFKSPTPKLLQVDIGPLMSRLVKIMDGKIHQDSKNKMVIFSAHDTNVINFLLALESFNNRQPPYSSAVIVELYQNQKMFYVKLLYHNDSNTEPHHLTIPGCQVNSTCASGKLRRAAKKITFSTNEREEFCGTVFISHSMNISDNIIPVAIVIVICVCFVLSIIMYRVYRHRRRPMGDPMMYKPLAYDDDEEL